MQRRRTNRFERGAFSLVELVLVLAIVGIMAALAAPRYATSIDRYRAETAARKVAADLRWAQTRAVAVGAPRVVTFDVATSAYAIAGETDPDRPGRPFAVDLAARDGAAIVSASFNGTPAATFNGYGISPAGGTVVIRHGTCSKTIKLDEKTGVVSIE